MPLHLPPRQVLTPKMARLSLSSVALRDSIVHGLPITGEGVRGERGRVGGGGGGWEVVVLAGKGQPYHKSCTCTLYSMSVFV